MPEVPPQPDDAKRVPAHAQRVEHVPLDDRVVGKVFWISLVVAALIAALVGAGVAFMRRPVAVEPTHEAAPPGARATPTSASAEAPSAPFVDVSAASGIHFAHVNGAYGERLLPETMGSGVAFIDYDNDGDQDLVFVNSAHWPWQPPVKGQSPSPALYRNRGNGTFDDVTPGSGLDRALYGMGIAAADYDGDGFVDLFISALGANRLLRNEGGERFVDVTAAAGVGGSEQAWSTAAAFFDADGDGDLDLFVGNYVQWSRELDLQVDYRLAGIGRAYGPPTNYPGAHPYLYRNEGDGRFVDVTRAAGLEISHSTSGSPIGKTLSVLPVDVDGDGRLDLAVANDTVANFLFHNLGDGRFEEIGVGAGLAFDNNGAATGAMGIDAARAGDGGALTIAMGNFANEMTSFYVSDSGALFTDDAAVSGIGPATRQALTFGLFFFDYDLDGRLDLLQANGHLEQAINTVQASQHFRQPAQLFWNCGRDCPRQYLPVPTERLGDLGIARVARGSAYADIDGDGDLDTVLTQAGGEAVLLRNEQRLGNHWLRVKLIGARKNTDAIGATVTLHAGNLVQQREIMPTRSYLSQSELPLTFGLGPRKTAERLVIRWPDGHVDEHAGLAIDRLHIIHRQP